jgi:uncharacterized protein (TIGR02646 family)
MRPVERGSAPRTYIAYQDALNDLADVIGHYCSYCERFIDTHLAVEHIVPKSRRRSLINTWSNFLLACVNCNSCKGKRHVVLDRFVWPDCDNTLLTFEYTIGGVISPSPRIAGPIRQAAEMTIALVGLDRYPGNPDRRRSPTISDKRWLRRYEAWGKAEHDKVRLQASDTPEARQHIAEKAAERGMFSIWLTVFHDDSDMKRRLFEAFIGTAPDCFDVNWNAVNRPGGKI